MPDFMPRPDDELSRWFGQFLSAATANATALGLGPADLAQLADVIANYKNSLRDCAAAVAAARSSTTVKNNNRRIAQKLVRTLAKRATTQPDYNDGLGELLGILTAAAVTGDTTPAAPEKPIGRVVALPDYGAEIRPRMKGAQAVDIYCQREGDTAPVCLGRVTHARFVDKRDPLVPGKPEKRHYTFQLIRNDKHWSPMSDIISVICSA